VTRCACEKIAQIVAQAIFAKINKNILPWKKPEHYGYFCNFQKIAQVKQSPNRRNFAQSGHPDLIQVYK
jgi:hypothetical protein